MIRLGQPGCMVQGQQYQDRADRGQDDGRDQSPAMRTVAEAGRLHGSSRGDRRRSGSHARLNTPTDVRVAKSWSAIWAALGSEHRAARSLQEPGEQRSCAMASA